MLGSVFAGLTAYIVNSFESVGTVFTAWKKISKLFHAWIGEKSTLSTYLLPCIVLLLATLAFACQ